jgi:hypothetical protein
LKAVARLPLIGLVLVTLLTAGCVSLSPARIPSSSLDAGTGNGWQHDPANSTEVEGGWFSKRSVDAYLDQAEDDRGHPGRTSIVSIRGLLSPDREELRDRVEEQLRSNAERNGLELSSKANQGQRTLANGARSFFITFNATAASEGSVFASDAEVRLVGEVFRCTGGATVVVTGSAQVSESQSVGGVPTSEERDARTWAEIVRDPSGTIDGHRGQGLIYMIACGG